MIKETWTIQYSIAGMKDPYICLKLKKSLASFVPYLSTLMDLSLYISDTLLYYYHPLKPAETHTFHSQRTDQLTVRIIRIRDQANLRPNGHAGLCLTSLRSALDIHSAPI
jgi:hypothetical protein